MAGYETPIEVATAFIEGRKARKKLDTMMRAGNCLYSYGYHARILKRNEDGTYALNTRKRSLTTTRHQTACALALHYAGYCKVREEPNTGLEGWTDEIYAPATRFDLYNRPICDPCQEAK